MQAYGPPPSKHGGGFNPNQLNSPFASGGSYSHGGPSQSTPHGGGINPASPFSNPSVFQQPQPVQQPIYQPQPVYQGYSPEPNQYNFQPNHPQSASVTLAPHVRPQPIPYNNQPNYQHGSASVTLAPHARPQNQQPGIISQICGCLR